MKYTSLFIVLSAATITGCTGMMYGKTMAPVTTHNRIYGKPLHLQSSIPSGLAVDARAQTPSPAGAQTSPATHTGDQTSGSDWVPRIDTVQSSPYQTDGWDTTDPGAADGGDGWTIRPQEGTQEVDTLTETAENPSQSVGNTKPQPIRPPDSLRAADAQSEEAAPTQPAQMSAPRDTVARAAGSADAARATSSRSAVDTLLKRASAALGKGDLDGAAAYLEDAQRIDSKNPKILYDIANIRYHQGKYRAAEAAASRAVRVGGNNEMMQKTWSLIANSRKALGDNQGAITAAEKAASL